MLFIVCIILPFQEALCGIYTLIIAAKVSEPEGNEQGSRSNR